MMISMHEYEIYGVFDYRQCLYVKWMYIA